MKKIWKILLIIGAAALLLGLVLFLIALAISGWNIHALSNSVIENKTYTEPEGARIETLTLDFENAEITLQLDPNATGVSLTYPQKLDNKQNKKNEITITESETELTVSEKEIWYRNLFSLWNFEKAEVTLILPADRAYALTLKTANGSIVLTGDIANAKSVSLRTANGRIDTSAATICCSGGVEAKTSNGKLTLGKIEAASLSADADNGMVELAEAELSEKLSLSTNNGKVVISGAISAKEIELRSDNGNIICESALHTTALLADTDNGDVRISGPIDAEEIALSTNNGNLSASLSGRQSDYTVSIKQDVGKSNVAASTGGDRSLNLQTDNGTINISFETQ